MTDEHFHRNLRVAALLLRQTGAASHNRDDRDVFVDAAIDVDAARRQLSRLESDATFAAAQIERLDAKCQAREKLAAERLAHANDACCAQTRAESRAERLVKQLHDTQAKYRAARAEVRVLTRTE